MQVIIKKTSELIEAIENAIGSKTPEERYPFTYSIAKYKWYNYYMYTHVKQGSLQDQANEVIFTGLKEVYPEIHKEIEAFIDKDIDKYNLELDD